MKMNLQTWAVESLDMGYVQNRRGYLYNLHISIKDSHLWVHEEAFRNLVHRPPEVAYRICVSEYVCMGFSRWRTSLRGPQPVD